MKKIYILQTSFNDVYENDLGDNGSNSISNFGNNESVAFLSYDEKVNINYSFNTHKSEKENLILVSDDIFGGVYNKDNLTQEQNGVLSKLLKAISKEDEIYLYWHISFGAVFPNFMQDHFPEQVVTNKGFSHLEHKVTPFYTLVEIVNSNTQEEFNEKLVELRGFLDSDEEIENKILDKIRVKLINGCFELLEIENKIGKKRIENFEDLFKRDINTLIEIITEIII